MKLVIPPNQIKKLKSLEKKDRERIKKKLDEIDNKISNLGIEPGKVIEKRLTGKLHPFLQQRTGKWRLWFKEEKKLLKLEAIKKKKEAKKHY